MFSDFNVLSNYSKKGTGLQKDVKIKLELNEVGDYVTAFLKIAAQYL